MIHGGRWAGDTKPTQAVGLGLVVAGLQPARVSAAVSPGQRPGL